MPTCVRNMTVIPLFGDFFLRERQDWQKLRQHDCPSLTPISDAADSQTPPPCTLALYSIVQCTTLHAAKRKEPGKQSADFGRIALKDTAHNHKLASDAGMQRNAVALMSKWSLPKTP